MASRRQDQRVSREALSWPSLGHLGVFLCSREACGSGLRRLGLQSWNRRWGALAGQLASVTPGQPHLQTMGYGNNLILKMWIIFFSMT